MIYQEMKKSKHANIISPPSSAIYLNVHCKIKRTTRVLKKSQSIEDI